MREQARVVVVGGGAVGAGVLYGLARRGWHDCLLLERHKLADASTRLAGGFIPTYIRSDASSRLINRTIEIYKGLEADTGQAVGWHPCGQMRIARSAELMDEFRSYMTVADAIGAQAELLTPAQAIEKWPLIESTAGMQGALFHPGDGYVSPTDVTIAMVRGATRRGATVKEDTEAASYRLLPSGEWRITTNTGEIDCEHLVLATGNYARRNGAKLGLNIPCWPVVVQYWFTESIPEVAERQNLGLNELPITRDEYWLGYARQEGDGIMFGTYERPEDLELFDVENAAPGFEDRAMPADFDANARGFELGMEVMPALRKVGIKSNIRGPMQMTGDGMPLAGPAWGLNNVWLAEGVPGGILWGGALGECLAEWITEGSTSVDMNELDPRRFGDHATGEWVRRKAVEIWGKHSDVILPGEELQAGRPAKLTPAHERFSSLGAVWGAVNGWEVANWYAPEGMEPVDLPGYRATRAEFCVREEVKAVRTAVGLVDMSAAAKFEVTGHGARDFLNRVFATALPAPGSVGGAYQLFPTGGVRAAYSVACLDEHGFLLTASANRERLYFDELRRLLPEDGVRLRNVTALLGCFSITGPEARQVMSKLLGAVHIDSSLLDTAISMTEIGLVPEAMLVQTSSTGEAGWDIYYPMASQVDLLEQILKAGKAFNLRLIGQRALNPLRLEKSYPAVGPDMNAAISAVEAGLSSVIDTENHNFIGREAVLEALQTDPQRRLVTLMVNTQDASLLGNETVYYNGKTVGRVTSGAYSPTFNCDIALALLPADLTEPGTALTVPVLDTVRTARIVAPSPYDPENLRLKG